MKKIAASLFLLTEPPRLRAVGADGSHTGDNTFRRALPAPALSEVLFPCIMLTKRPLVAKRSVPNRSVGHDICPKLDKKRRAESS